MGNNFFSLDFGEKYIRIADAKLSGNKLELVNFGSADTITNFFSIENQSIIEKQAEIIANLANTLKVKNKTAHVVIPDSVSYSQITQMPKLNEKELLAAIRYQADQFIPMPIEEVALDIETLYEDEKNNKLTILIVACSKKIVEQIEKTLDMAGITYETLENELSALGRLFYENYKPKTQNFIAVINFGYTSSSIYLIDGPTSLILVPRNFKVGLNLFIKDLKVNFSIDETKALEILRTTGLENNDKYEVASVAIPILKEIQEEVNRFNLLAKDQYNRQIDRVYIYNHSPLIKDFDKKIESLISLPTQSINLAEICNTNQFYKTHQLEVPFY
ncbi:MAG: pilus assembly protein PilM, partial [Microgenomates group bacterium]|nr:pilus assembly protein PilM [Microgenomates group bacterium]